MKITVVMPVINEGPDLEATVAMMAQEYRPPDHVVVVDDCSIEPIEPRLRPFTKMFPEFTVHRFEKGMTGAGAAKSAGCDIAINSSPDDNDLIVVMDCHMRPEWKFWYRLELWSKGHPNTVLCPISRGFDHDAGLHFGAQLMPGETGIWKAAWNRYPANYPTAIGADAAWRDRTTHAPRIPIAYGGCYIFPKRVLKDIGGYAPKSTAWGYEEEYFSWRVWSAGYEIRLMHSIDMAMRHHYRPNDRPIPPRKDAHGHEWPIGSGWKNIELAHRAMIGNDRVNRIYKRLWMRQPDYKEHDELHEAFPVVRTPECVDAIMGIVHPESSDAWPALCKRLELRHWPLVSEEV